VLTPLCSPTIHDPNILFGSLSHHASTSRIHEWPNGLYLSFGWQNGSTLRDHLDVLETHVISGILHIDSDLDAPYPIQIEDGFGVLRSADLKPGDLMFYESAKCFHQRKEPMQGRHYASIFMHYRPKGWARSREEARFAIPPYWADGLPRDQGGESSSSDSSSVAAASSFDVTFVNNGNALVRVFWLGGGGARVAQGALAAGESLALATHAGHAFVAVATEQGGEADSDVVRAWTMASEFAGTRLLVDPYRPDTNDGREL
jgi:hypothetical protein